MAIDGNRILVLAPRRNTGAKKDATGAFQPEALAFAVRRGVPKARVAWIDNELSKPAMRKAVLAAIAAASADGPLQALALFCHGWKTGIQLGFDRATVGALATAIAAVPDVRVPIYACNTAKGETGSDADAIGGDGGFADLLRDALCAAGAVHCQVDAHTTAGHATKNPFVRRFEGKGSPAGGSGGSFLVTPGHKPLWAKWRKALATTPLRYDFPFLTNAEILASL